MRQDGRMDSSVSQLRDLAVHAAIEGAQIARHRRQEAQIHGTKSSSVDVVTQIDIAVEEHIRTLLLQQRPHDGILGEEGHSTEGTSGITWVVDPIDGTVNYVYGLESCSVSVAAVSGNPRRSDGAVQAGAVVDIPVGQVWSAGAGEGAEYDGNPLKIESGPDLAHALVATGFQYVSQIRERQGAVVAQLLPQVRDIRRLGSCALDLCMVAAGRVDAYYEHGLSVWDFAAASLIAREAGVRVEGFDGNPAKAEFILAAPDPTFAALHDALSEAGARTVMPRGV